jgi:hypothetical protein
VPDGGPMRPAASGCRSRSLRPGRDVWMTTVVAETVVRWRDRPARGERAGLGHRNQARDRRDEGRHGAAVAAAATDRPPKSGHEEQNGQETSGESRRRLMAFRSQQLCCSPGYDRQTRFPRSTLGQLAPAVNPVEGPVPDPVLSYQPDTTCQPPFRVGSPERPGLTTLTLCTLQCQTYNPAAKLAGWP